ncbi:MAG: enoyl-CoA hydratase/isomerase family protein [Kordiimonadaceae bacterium]|jgi:enoyl-CoA hydratase|nr:enoyl-CoA hydratase/isomerase family protein [Kordiimonadaceae bacterium]MBT6032815.1 enoyl-CoA hydratase/isomerase family protein [Kordiimonadaceae bacterium]MBT6330367.1 enoyl-CoA hydratase/isomerase family protein [Kordiimonadaceae bacterium]MBT7583852.1 enoyl-CoA hydratase/isomerase family protein [Kordiimonadaceae bacterium]
MVNQVVKISHSETNPHIAVVSINRPENYNSLTAEVMDGLKEAAEKISMDSDIRAVILTGEGGYFCSGADFSVLQAIQNENDTNKTRVMGAKAANVCVAWEAVNQPTIAAIEGGVVGGGLAVAMACDFRVMAEGSYAYVPEVKVGLNFGMGSLPRLTRLVGPAKAKLMSIFCYQHKAEECKKWGLADYVTENGKSMDKALEMAEEIAAFPRLPVQLIKRGVNVAANALNPATGYADTEDLILCAKDEEATKYRNETIKSIKKK